MSDTRAEHGSSTGGVGSDSPPRKSSINDKDSSYATEKYVNQPEKYEQIAIGDCSSDANAAVENHSKEMEGEIKKTDEKLGA
ncbi:hypothetical protein NA56DRAFT_709162 [Hyaloscypha hepaticicola]|uniref:Uncharacterized protein n=1 Tax=Hyaloscypha hepaticicola TaxID=2082293 RepID=A0A2J6PPW4_9HELO|nr:hypothetical protein NA56DRAFT_709162 [Hyaloscypha hepaticicola]